MSHARRLAEAGALGRRSIPYYGREHSGPLLVIGSAWCALEDVAAAKRIYRRTPFMVVNDAVRHFRRAPFVVSMHYEELHVWREIREAQPGRFTVHSTFPTNGQPPDRYAAVDYWWPGCHSAATSAWLAVRIGKLMGFSPIVLCGCPLEPAGYVGETMPAQPDPNRLGHMRQTSPILRTYREAMARYVDEGEGEGVYSMSGWTRGLLGPPPGASPQFPADGPENAIGTAAAPALGGGTDA